MSTTYSKGKIKICISDTEEELGEIAAKDASEIIKNLLSIKDEVNVVFAAAPSQNEFLRNLLKDNDIEWDRINAFQMDEYIGCGLDTDYSFAHYLNLHIFSKATFKHIFYMCCEDDYASLIKKYPIDIVFLGVGENGHIAFNEPDKSSFDDKEIIRTIELDEKSRHQQVNDKCFDSLDKVPTKALTLTIPTLMSATHLICCVPGIRKAGAISETINGPISQKCPASIMRRHQHCTIYLDKDSSSLLEKEENAD